MKITEVQISNIMKIRYVQMVPEDCMTVIGGKNRQGKTSFLNAIAMAIGGKKLCPAKPIRNGSECGEVRVKVDGDAKKGLPPSTIVRKFSLKKDGTVKSEMEIISDEGYRAPEPQTLLNSVISNATFDPLYFASLPTKEQAENLKRLVGLDTSQQEKRRASVFETRRIVGQDMRKLEGHLKSLPAFDKSAPKEPVLASDVMAEMESARAVNESNEKKRSTLADLKVGLGVDEERVARAQDRVDSMEAQLAEAKLAHEKAVADMNAVKDRVDNGTKHCATLVDIDLSPFRARLDEVDKVNEKVRQNQKRYEVEAECADYKERYQGLSDEIEIIDKAVALMYETAAWPIDGLGFDSDGVTYQGMPFDQCSEAEKLDVSVAMGFAMNPTLRMLVIRNGSLLDEDSLAHVAELAKQNDGQVFVERVGEGTECHLILRDGEEAENSGEEDDGSAEE